MAKILDLIGLGVPWQLASLIGDDAPARPTTAALMGIGVPAPLADALGDKVATSTPALLVSLGMPPAHANSVQLSGGPVTPALSITGAPGSYTAGTAGTFAPSVSGGTAPYSFSLSGSLPSGWSFSGGTVSIPSSATAGTVSGLSITVTDAKGAQATLGPFAITVVAAGGTATPWTLNGKMVALGDSRTQLGGGVGGASGTSSYTLSTAGNYIGHLQYVLDNALLLDQDFQHGVGSSTSESVKDRYASPNTGDPNGTAAWVAGANTGTGTMAGTTITVASGAISLKVGNTARVGSYKVTFSSATAFTVTRPDGTTLTTGTISATSGQTAVFGPTSPASYPMADFEIAGKITQGATAFATGDSFTLAVAAPINPAFNLTGNAGDIVWDSPNVGGTTATTSAADLAILFISRLDSSYLNGSYTPTGMARSLANLAGIVDGLIAAGKKVVLVNETPAGVGYAPGIGAVPTIAEVPAAAKISGATIQAAQAAYFYQDGADAGLGSGVYNTANDTWYTKVASNPAVGQYTVSSAGLYTFNASDTIISGSTTTALLSYFIALDATGTALPIINAWCNSSDAVFSYGSTSYGLPGAKYGRSASLEVADVWGALLDPVASAALGVPTVKVGLLDDARHFTPLGGRVAAGAVKAAIARRTTLASRTPAPTRNGFWQLATTASTTKTWSGTLPGIMAGTVAKPTTPGITKIGVNTLLSDFDIADGPGSATGTFSGSGISGTINYQTGAITITLPAAPTAGKPVFVTQDISNFLANGLFDPAQGGVALPSGVTGSQTPTGWTMTTTGFTVGAGGVQIAVDTSKLDDDGYPMLRLTLSGHANVAGTIVLTSALVQSAFLALLQQTDNVRTALTTKIDKGANGHLSGILGVHSQMTMGSSTPFNRAGVTGATIIKNTSQQGSANYPMTDLDVASGAVKFRNVGLPVSMQGVTPGSTNLVIVTAVQPGPVSSVIDLSRADMGPKTW